MRYAIIMTVLFTVTLFGETLTDKLSNGDVAGLKESIKVEQRSESEQEKRVRDLTQTSDKELKEVSVEVAKVEVNDKTSVSVEYAPELKQGDVVDNKEKTSINLNYKF